MAETSSEKTREPFVRVAKRTGIHWYQSWGIRIVAVFLALIVNALFIHGVTGLNPVEVYRIMWTGTFESKYNFRRCAICPSCIVSLSRWLPPSACGSGTSAGKARFSWVRLHPLC